MKSFVSFACSALLAVPLVSHAMGPGPVPAAATSFRVGSLSVSALSDTEYVLPNDGKIFGVDAGAAAVAQVLRAAQAPADAITLPVDALLVRDGARVILIDAGLGPKLAGALVASLALTGTSPADVTDVLITHPHPDHVGGLLTMDGHLAFPNAKIRMSAPDWKDFVSHGDEAALAHAIEPQVEAFEPGASITPSIRSVSLPGHTPGHVGYRITSGSDSLLDVGDVVHSAIVSLAEPDWTMGFDQDPQGARSMRRRTLGELAQSHQLVFAPHFPYPGIGTIELAGSGFKWQPSSLPRTH
jgi:glyoxylase-like metal-dependent hydrolase (beta-lactamase superfamily II)